MVVKLQLAEFKMQDGDFSISVRTKEFTKVKGSPGVQAHHATVTPQSPPAEPVGKPADEASGEATASKAAPAAADGLVEIKSPIVGTFYRSAAPDKPPFVKVGDTIEAGNVVCIVEAMKLFNEIESEVRGKIVKVLVEDATPVEYDQALFLVDPKG